MAPSRHGRVLREAIGDQLQWVFVGAGDQFLKALSDVTDPEIKRRTIGALFIDVFERSPSPAAGLSPSRAITGRRQGGLPPPASGANYSRSSCFSEAGSRGRAAMAGSTSATSVTKATWSRYAWSAKPPSTTERSSADSGFQ